MMSRTSVLTACVSWLLLWTGNAWAVVMTYTSSSDFFAALAGQTVITETYEGFPLNSLILDGSTLNDLTYETFPDGTDGRIDDLYNRIGNQSLALQRGDDATAFFFPGEAFTVTFPSLIHAVGIFFNVSASPEGSLQVATAVGSAGNGHSYDQSTLYFVGLISDSPFASATFSATQAASSGFNVDDLSYAPVPEPSTLALLGGAAILLGRRRRRADPASTER